VMQLAKQFCDFLFVHPSRPTKLGTWLVEGTHAAGPLRARIIPEPAPEANGA
jgi:hypothetical protein